MIDIAEYITKIKEDYGSDYPDFAIDFTDFLLANNYFGHPPVKCADNKFYFTRTFFKASQKAVAEYCNNYGSSTDDIMKRLRNKLHAVLPETEVLFADYCATFKIPNDQACEILDRLIYWMPGELITSSNAEIKEFADHIADELTLGTGQIVAEFFDYIMVNHHTYYTCHIQLESRYEDKENAMAYDSTTYLKLMYHLFNSDYVNKNQMYKKAAESKEYADTYLYLCIPFFCALRNSDIVRIPHPALPKEPQTILKEIIDGSFEESEAMNTLESIIHYLRWTELKPNKTSKYSGVATIKFNVPVSCQIHMGTLFAIAEAHFRITNGDKCEKALIIPSNDFRSIEAKMGEEIGDLFRERNFSIRSMNKSYLQALELYANQKDAEGQSGINGYLLAALARTHKGSFGDFAETTKIYLRDAKMNGYTPELVSRELLERGVLSNLASMLLSMCTAGKYEKLLPHDQTEMIKNLNLPPSTIEHITAIAQKSMSQSSEIAVNIYQSKNKKDILAILHRLASDVAASKQDDCMCFMTAMGKTCPFKITNCIGCAYNICTISTFINQIAELKRNVELYKTADNDLIKKKHETIVNDCILPALDTMLTCMENEYGKEQIEIYSEIIKRYLNE